MDSDNRSRKKIFIWGGLIILVLIAAIYAYNEGSKMTPVDTEQNDEVTADLMINVSRSSEGILLSTTETDDLKKCTVTINNKYSAEIDVITSEVATHPYSTFTDNGTRFDYDTMQPEHVLITDCENKGSDYAEFDW